MPAPLVADAVKPMSAPARLPAVLAGKTIWIDLENTPHIPFFKLIIRELDNVVLTAPHAFQVCELADKCGLPYKRTKNLRPRLFCLYGEPVPVLTSIGPGS
jgi:hypothetical protein